MRLTYRLLTRNIARCELNTEALVAAYACSIGETRDGATKWNMSSVITRRVIVNLGERYAVVCWRNGEIIQESGDLPLEIVRGSGSAETAGSTIPAE